MSDLDKRLINAVCSYASGANQRVRTERELLDNALSNIKQAFTDAGYVDTSKFTGVWMNPDGSKNPYMTGQEWYDRFEKEITHTARWKELPEDAYPHTINDAPITVGELLAAAKKATGLG